MRFRSMRIAALASAAALLSGCAAIPPVVSAVSYAIDGVSYLASGKSVSDHALSAAADRDCALLRIFSSGAICRDYTQTAAKEPIDLTPAPNDFGERQGAREGTANAPVLQAAPGPKRPNLPPAVLAAGTKPVPRLGQHYLVLASFREPMPADQLAAAHRGLDARVKPADVDGKHWYRVVIGPASVAELQPIQAKLGGVGIERPWLLRVNEPAPLDFETLALALEPNG